MRAPQNPSQKSPEERQRPVDLWLENIPAKESACWSLRGKVCRRMRLLPGVGGAAARARRTCSRAGGHPGPEDPEARGKYAKGILATESSKA